MYNYLVLHSNNKCIWFEGNNSPEERTVSEEKEDCNAVPSVTSRVATEANKTQTPTGDKCETMKLHN